MRNLMAVVAVSASLSSLVVLPGVAWPASDTSVQDVIDALKPNPGKSRGSKPVVAPPSGDSTVTPMPMQAIAPGSAPARVAASTMHAAPAVADDRPSLDFNITFTSGSADLSASAMKVLNVLGKALASADLSASKFRIEGHTDTVGTPESNRELSGRRAQAVVDYLGRSYGITGGRLEAVGMGEESPMIPTGPQVNEQRNRRVHVVNVSA